MPQRDCPVTYGLYFVGMHGFWAVGWSVMHRVRIRRQGGYVLKASETNGCLGISALRMRIPKFGVEEAPFSPQTLPTNGGMRL